MKLLRHRRRRVHRLELRPPRARAPPTTTSTVSTPSPTPGNHENLDDLEDDPRFRFVQGDICDRDAVRGGDGRPRRRRALRRREPRRPLDRRPRRVRPHQLRRHQRAVRRGPPGRRRALPPHLDRRGVRLDRARARSPRTDRARAPLAVLGQQGGQRPHRARRTTRRYGLPVIVTRSSNNFGPYQFPEKVIPLFATNLLDGQHGAALRRRRQRPRLVLRRRQLPRPSTSCCAQGVVGEIYNIGAGNEMHQPRADRSGCWRVGRPRRDDRVRRRPARATTAATRSTRRRSRRSAGGPSGELGRGRSRPPSPGTATTGGGGSRSKAQRRLE